MGTGWSLGNVVVVTIAAVLFHIFVLRPWAQRWLAAARPENIAVRAGISLAINASQLIWLMLAISALLTWAAIWIATGFGGVTFEQVDEAISHVATLRAWVTSIESWSVWVLFVLASAALLFWIYRRKLRQQANLSSQLRQAQFEDLLRQKVDGKLEEREPSDDMLKIVAIIDQVADEVTAIDEKIAATAPGSERRELEAAREALTQNFDMLRKALIVADVSRYLPESTVDHLDSEIEEPPRTWLQYIGRFFISGRLIGQLSGLQRLALIANLLLAVPTLLAVAQGDIAARLEARLVTLRDMRVQLLASEEKGRFDAALAEAERIEPPPTPQPDDDDDPSNLDQVTRVANKVGRLFENSSGDAYNHFINNDRGPEGDGPRRDIFEARSLDVPSPDERKAILEAESAAKSYQARKEVLANAAVVNRPGPDGAPKVYVDPDTPKGPSGGGVINERIPGVDESASKILIEGFDPDGKPISAAGRSLAEDVKALAKSKPAAYRALARAIRSPAAEKFTQVARPARVIHIILAAALGGGTEIVPDGILDPVFNKYVEGLADGPTRIATYKRMSIGFLGNLIETKDPEKAFLAADRLAHAELATRDPIALRSQIEAGLPAAKDLGGTLRNLSPGLRQRVAKEVSSDIKIGDTPLGRAALSEFDHIFPPNAGQVGTNKVATLSVTLADVSHARSFTDLHRSTLVGGVLIGRDPDTTEPDISISSLGWERREDGISLKLGLDNGQTISAGPFHPALLHHALVYAADGRPLTVTIITAKPLDDQKIFLHPALLDTALGCRAIRLDQFAFVAVRGGNSAWQSIKMAITADKNLYELARLAVIGALGPSRFPENNQPTTKGSIRLLKELLWMEYADRNNEKYKAVVEALTEGTTRSNSNGYLDRSDHFNPEITRLVKACTGSKEANLEGYLSCLKEQASVRFRSEMISNKSQRWLINLGAPVPQFQIVSGVREASFKADRDLAFLTSDIGKILTFTIQAPFSTPPYQALSSGWDVIAEGSDEQKTTSEPFTFELPSLEKDILNYVGSDPARLEILRNMQEFTALQRLFRMAFAGKLGEHFPFPRLGELARETAANVRLQETLRWKRIYGDVEFLSEIGRYWAGLAPPAKEAVGACLKANSLVPEAVASLPIEDLRQQWLHHQGLDDANWDKHCKFTELAKQGENDGIFEYIAEQSILISERRRARRDLGVEASEKMGDPDCEPVDN